MKPIYLDYAATTPVDPRVADAMSDCLLKEGHFGNPASSHCYGQAAHALIEKARAEVAAYLYADPTEIIWTSGATEANNLAIKGAARLYQRKGRHFITMQTEHKAVLDTFQYLEKEGCRVTYLQPRCDGQLDLAELAAALQADTVLVSIMHVNNETGVIQDLAAIAAMTAARGVLLHVDAAQSVGKVLLDTTKLPIDLISLSAHKVYGPKGMGALYLRKKPRVRVAPLIHGGGHEGGMRSGTLATHQIVGMGKAFAFAQSAYTEDLAHVKACRARFLEQLHAIPNFKLNVDENVVPHIVSARFDGMLADGVLAAVPAIATSTASACQGKGIAGSYVLRAMGLTDEQVKSSLRFSFGRFTTLAEVDKAARLLKVLFAN